MGKKQRKAAKTLTESTERLFCEVLHLSIPPPPEICVLIFSYLEREDLLMICQVNRAWYNLTRSSREYNEIWWRICNSGTKVILVIFV